MTEFNPESENVEIERPRQGRQDQDIERQRREEVLGTLSNHNDGLGFNELAEKVEHVISRVTLKDRLDDYDDEGLIQMPKDHRRGQKKRIQLTEKGTPPEGLEEIYEQWMIELLTVWQDVLEQYNNEQDSINHSEILKHVLTWRFRWDLRETVVASTADEEYQEMLDHIDIPDDAVPNLESSTEDFYLTLAAELWKYYTEKIYGEAHIETLGKATQIQKDALANTFHWSIGCREQIYKMWDESPVPKGTKNIEDNG